jgi:4-hydroxy-4-methyl-2-oxoglutarate aldolase
VERDGLIECGGVRMRSGDILFGDIDGVVVIPQGIASECLARAEEKVTKENVTRQELEQGLLLGEVYAKYGVL